MRHYLPKLGIFIFIALQYVNLSAQVEYTDDELKIDFKTPCSYDKKGNPIHCIELNDRQITEKKYCNVYQSKGYIFAAYNCRVTRSSYAKRIESWGNAADIFDANGRLIHSASEGYRDVKRYKEPDFTMWQKTDLSWYDENGEFIYKGGFVVSEVESMYKSRYEGDYSFLYTIGGHFYFIIKNGQSYKKEKLVLYDANKKQVGSMSLNDEILHGIDLNPIGYFIIVGDDCYDLKLKKVPYMKYGGGIEGIAIDGTTHVFKYDWSSPQLLPHFNNKNIKGARKYEKQNLVLVQMEDGSVFDLEGKLLFKSNSKLPSSSDLYDAGNGKYYVWTHEGNKKGISTLDGKEILAPEFDEVKVLADNFFTFKLNGYWGVMKVAGNVNKVIIPIERAYTKIEYSRTLKQFTFEKVGAKGTCNINGVQTSITKVAPPPAPTPSQPANNNNNNNNNNQQQQRPQQSNQPNVQTPVYIACPICGGTLHCPTCAGQGTYWSGSDKRRCGVCNGTGVCQGCHGTGTSGVIYN